MNCRDVNERLTDYIDGSLGGKVRDVIAAHLEACSDCREEHRLLVMTRRLLSTYGAARAPVDFTYLASRVAARRRGSELLLWLRRGLATAAAAAAVAAVAWQWQRSAPVPAGPAPPRVVVREVAEAEELHQAFAVQQSLDARDGLVLLAPEWVERD